MKDKIWNRKLLSGIVICLMVACISGCTGRRTAKRSIEAPNVQPQTEETSIEGVVTANDTELGQLTLRDAGGTTETVLGYDGSAEMTDRFGDECEGEHLAIGEILEVKYNASNGMILSTQVPKDVWEYSEVDQYQFDTEEKSIAFAERKYQYNAATFFYSGEQEIQQMELNPKDVLTIRGIGYKVYSVVRTEGHGYLRLKHYEDFIGGMVEVGKDQILEVTKNMLITVRAGTYKVILSKGGTVAAKPVTIPTDEEVTLDFSDHEPVDDKIGMITFDIEPPGADLTINGTAVNYKRPIGLAYGTYRLDVSMTGYQSYSGTLDVADDSKVRIRLSEELADGDAEKTPNTTKKKNQSTKTQKKKMDSEHTITVSEPEGAEVYLDNVYKGVVPCTFTKIIGTQTLTLSRTGSITKSYTVDILDDGKDSKLSFAPLPESAEASEASEAPLVETTETAG